jgi:hypothetical protein
MDRDRGWESHLRREARRQGFILRKSRTSWPDHDDQGKYALFDAADGSIVAGARFDLDLDQVDVWLALRRTADIVMRRSPH